MADETLDKTFYRGPKDGFDAAFWNTFTRELQARFSGFEVLKANAEDIAARGVQVALQRINEVITPTAERLQRLSTVGFLLAPSATSVALELDEVVTFTILPGDARELFSPSPFLALTHAGSHQDYGVGKKRYYDPETGTLEVEVVAVAGDPGPHDDWLIGAVAGSTVAQVAMLADARAARDAAEAHRAVVEAKAAQVAADADQTAGDRIATAADVIAAAASAATAIAKAAEATSLVGAALGAVQWKGYWNASTNSPAIPAAATGNKGWYYIVTTAGATDLNGETDWKAGDYAISNGAAWSKIDNTDRVIRVAGLEGDITADQLKTALGWSDKADVLDGFVTITAAAYTIQASDIGKVLRFNRATAQTITFPNSLAAGGNGFWRHIGAGAVTFVAASGATLVHRLNHTKSGGQKAEGGWAVDSNAGGAAAIVYLSGDTAA